MKYGPDFKDLRLHRSRAEKRSFMSLKQENCSWILEKTSIREADMHAVRVAVWIAYHVRFNFYSSLIAGSNINKIPHWNVSNSARSETSWKYPLRVNL